MGLGSYYSEEYIKIPQRSAAVAISVLSLLLSIADLFYGPACLCRRGRRAPHDHRDRGFKILVNWIRVMLVLLFQMANLLLLIASFYQNSTLVKIYIWYTILFVAVGAAVAVMDYVFDYRHKMALPTMVAEMAFLFVTFRCIPVMESYRKNLEHSHNFE